MNYIKEEKLDEVPKDIASNVGDLATFMLTYLMQVVFITNCIQMLDVPHFLWKGFFTLVNWIRYRPYKDDWFF